ncbi:ThiF family adenylyltransferase [Ralstonia pseudosolanacearum]|uniref:ThiF family adenylyltransferase n=1 Tax=Ralstonia pseudosolanacearum TaxID=1310165 RepID=UPI000DABAE2C|nr:ThiF family adenylyltransferase [Ralstonia pseudosolanacearum]RAA04938.1 ThiF family adenylyltransferase [Ralstonia pseudosolanacearum]
MSAKPAVLDSVLAPFLAAGLQVTVQGAHLLLHNVPVVDNQRQLQLGTLVVTLVYTDSQVTPPATHQAWLDGPFPCFADGSTMEQLRHSDVAGGMVAPGVPARFYFSNKDEGWTGYATHFDQLMHYWRIITDQARVIDPHCTRPLGSGLPHVAPRTDPFRYPDACSVRGNFVMVSERLANLSVAIVGLGGTGSYVLDQVAKTPVREIHLFDGDVFELHNAFRAPAAAQESDFGRPKVTYFAELYDPMRSGIVQHPSYVTDANVGLLGQFDFVFVCVDKGPARRLICSHLINRGVPFIDCGMDMSLSTAQQIFGTCRVTVATSAKNNHFFERAPTMEDAGDALYDQNIQIADANALNAVLAVMRWKQHFGFYAMSWDWHHLEFAISTMALAKAEKIEGADAN